VSLSAFDVVFIILHSHTKLILSLVVWIDHLIIASEKLPPQLANDNIEM